MVIGETLHRVQRRLAQTGLVRAAGRRWNQVDVGFSRQAAVGRPADGPGGTRTDRKILVAPGRVLLAAEHRSDHFAVDLLAQVLQHAIGKTPFAGRATLDIEHDLQTRQQQRLAAQQTFELWQRNQRRVEEARIRPGAHARAAGSLRRIAEPLQRLEHVTAGKSHAMPPAVADHLDFEPRRQRVGHRYANAVQAPREAIRRLALVLVELATGVQPGEHHFHRRHLFERVNLDWNTPSVVLDADRLVGVQGHRDAFAEAAQRLVGGVVDRLLDDVQRAIDARVHPGTMAHRLQPLENGDRFCGVAHDSDFSSRPRWRSARAVGDACPGLLAAGLEAGSVAGAGSSPPPHPAGANTRTPERSLAPWCFELRSVLPNAREAIDMDDGRLRGGSSDRSYSDQFVTP